MKVALIQFAPIWENKQANIQLLQKMLSKKETSIDLLIFPELTLTGFTMRSKKYAEAINGESVNFFANLAKLNSAHVIFGLIESEMGNCYNTLVHIDNQGEITSTYRKIHPFTFTGENRFYNQGHNPVITDINGFSFGLSICYDLRFPELFRLYGKDRVAGIISIANWPVSRITHWDALLKARAIENQCFLFGVNRVGQDKSNAYNGQSVVYSPIGKQMFTPNDKENIEIVDIDLSEVEDVQKQYPFLDDIKLM